MKQLFQFSRGEFWATILLLLIIVGCLLFYFFYERNDEEQIDLSAYTLVIEKFQEQQRSDSFASNRSFSSYHKKSYPPYNSNYAHSNQRRDSAYYRDTTKLKPLEKKQHYDIKKVDLNACDTNDILSIPQFGSKRAQKIVEYRDKLGGFFTISQLREIYILQNISLEHCEKYFVINRNKIRKININSISYKELIAHPYFDAYLTKQIINYREKNGKIKDISHFQQITNAYKELIVKLTPYLSFD